MWAAYLSYFTDENDIVVRVILPAGKTSTGADLGFLCEVFVLYDCMRGVGYLNREEYRYH